MESPTPLKFGSISDPGNRYQLQECVGSGVFGSVYVAIDSQAGGKRVAIKIQKLVPENEQFIQEEYKVLRDLSDHPNLPDFYGVYRKKGDPNYIWFVMELCEGGSALDLVLGLQCRNRRMSEEHIAYILRETIKALVHLHEHHTVHRDVRASNIMLTKEGEVKLVDFGLTCVLDGPRGKRTTCIGSPCWMAPEVVTGGSDIANPGYGNRVDVWALGIVAIELGDGKPPFEDIHPTRAMFQIVRNPPPTLYRPSNWSQIYNDFINECLEKNPEYRPYIVEIIDHPFFENIPENDYYLTQELKQLTMEFASKGKDKRKPECAVRRNLLKTGQDTQPERMLVEDLAALDELTEDTIIYELEERLRLNRFQTFVGDVLLILNPNEKQDIYGENYHSKYKCKSRSDNAPHIYAVADKAFQDVQHHEEPQHIILAGETLSGKTTAMIHLMEHFVFLGESLKASTGQQIMKALAIVHSLGNASTPTNPNSTRCILHTQLTFGGGAGKISGALFSLYQLEKWRVSTTNMSQSNFHIFYYFYDFMESENKLIKYDLEPGRLYRYLRIVKSKSNVRPRDNPKKNHEMFKGIQQNLKDLLFDDTQINIIFKTLAAILNLGNVQFKDTESKIAEIENPEVAVRVARLLDIDEKKFCWALTNYCLIKDGAATKRKHSSDEARDARDILAGNIYTRLVDWIVNIINYKLALGRAVFGDKYIINILDMYGFECFQRNKFEQILVNSFNEQIQYHYTQRMFAWEMLEQQEEHVPGSSLTYCDNRPCVESLMGTGTGIMAYLDEAAKNYHGYDHVIECLRRTDKKTHVKIISDHEFAVCHFTGTVQYDVREMVDKNRDFLPPEMVDCLRLSKNDTIRQFFTNALSKTGNLTLHADEFNVANTAKKERWGAALVKETQKTKNVDFQNRPGQYSQTRRMRTAASVFRATSLEVLRTLAIGAGSGGTHFVRCIRSDLANQPRGFRPDIVKQQLRALSILDTAKARQKGYPHRIPFQEFLKRYQFLAFDFDENVELTKDNCRLLLVRLKMEGWVIGKTKVFLKYYNEEFLSRLYETQVKKIIKVQSMMRTFLAKRNFASKLKKLKKSSSVEKTETKPAKPAKQTKQKTENVSQESAALAIQKAYRGYAARKRYGPLISKTGKLDQNTAEFLRPFASKWKAKSIFHVILLYRAARYQDTVYFSQQVHLYNQSVIKNLMATNHAVPLNHVDQRIRSAAWLGKRKPVVWKLPFNFDQLDYFDTSYMCDPYLAGGTSFYEDDQEAWDSPLRWRNTVASHMAQSLNFHESNMPSQIPGAYYSTVQPAYMAMPFCRETISNPGSRCGSQTSNYNAGHIPYHTPGNINHRNMYGVTPHQSAGNRCISQGSMYPHTSQHSPGRIGYGGAYRGCHSPIAKSCDDLRISPPNRNTSGITSHTPLRAPINTAASNKTTPSRDSNYDFDYNKSSAVAPSRYGVTKSSTPANPIKELERIGKKHTDDSDDDDPPFNFQGMLRKTNFNRDSMKRNKCNLDVSISQYRSSTPPKIYASDEASDNENNESRNRNSNVVYQSNSINSRRSKSCQDLTKRDQNKNETLSWADEIEENGPDGPLDIVSTEIAPGVIVQGIVSDL